ncbi:hypothetical protein AGMMS49940_13670 [Spirochaetia bacterium]|nr:hypothetical protein AGMMS49940_13670 [Spirochaetia bacterium]
MNYGLYNSNESYGENTVDNRVGLEHVAAIYYGKNTITGISTGILEEPLTPNQFRHAQDFINTFINGNSDVIIVSLSREKIYFAKQAGLISENRTYCHHRLEDNTDTVYNGTIKEFPLNIIKVVNRQDHWDIATAINRNGYLRNGTFKILDRGNGYQLQICRRFDEILHDLSQMGRQVAFFGCTHLTSIRIGGNVSVGNWTLFDNGFNAYYNTNGKKAGVYTFRNDAWSYAAR